MKYEEFREAVQHALRDVRLFSGSTMPEETIDISGMRRSYEAFMGGFNCEQKSKPFHVSVQVGWSWSALDSARSETIEEDVLTELYGRDEANTNTDQPLIRMDVKLHATLPYGNPITMPDAAARDRWNNNMMEKMEDLLLVPSMKLKDREPVPMSFLGEPSMQVMCGHEGMLLLDGVPTLTHRPSS